MEQSDSFSKEIALAQREYAVLRAELEQERARGAALLRSIARMHRALYRGSTSGLILRAAMDVTEAECGYFLSGTPDALVVRAAEEVPDEVGSAPSPFIASVARRVLATGEEFHWMGAAPPAGINPGDGEVYTEGLVVPVSTLGAPSGVIVVLDRDGSFRDLHMRSLLSVGAEAGVALENARLRDEIDKAYVSTITVLADAVQAKDPDTRGHCEQVSQYARTAARRLGLEVEEQRVTCYAALLHDVGKIGVSDEVLNKPGPLMPEERQLVQAHVRIGHALLSTVPALSKVADAVLHHHESFDGSGYPDGLAATNIPMASRIVAVVDAYCAMIDERSYKAPRTSDEARAEVLRCSGTQFDPQVVQAVLDAIAEVDAEVEDSRGDACGILRPQTATHAASAA